MNKYTFFIPRRLPGMNDIIDMARDHWSASAEQKKEYVDLVAGTIGLTFRFRKFNLKKVWINFTWVEKNTRRDPDNIASGKMFVLNGMVKAGMIKDDGWDQVAGFTDTWELGKEPGVWVEVREV